MTDVLATIMGSVEGRKILATLGLDPELPLIPSDEWPMGTGTLTGYMMFPNLLYGYPVSGTSPFTVWKVTMEQLYPAPETESSE